MKSKASILTLAVAVFLVMIFLFAMSVPAMKSMVDGKVTSKLPRVGSTLLFKEFPVGSFVPTHDWVARGMR